MLSDVAEREKIDSILTYARTLVLKEWVWLLSHAADSSALGAGYTPKVPDDDPRVVGMSPPLQTQLRTKAKQLILEESMDEKK